MLPCFSIHIEKELIMSAGKGDRYRPVDQKKYDEGWEAAFGKTSKKKTTKKKKDRYVNTKNKK